MCPRPAPSRCALLALSRAASPFPLFGGARRLQDVGGALVARRTCGHVDSPCAQPPARAERSARARRTAPAHGAAHGSPSSHAQCEGGVARTTVHRCPEKEARHSTGFQQAQMAGPRAQHTAPPRRATRQGVIIEQRLNEPLA